MLKTIEVARLLGVNRTTVLSWAYRGLFDYTTTPGGQRRFYREQIEAYLAAQYSRTAEPVRGPARRRDRPWERKVAGVPVTDQQVAVFRALMRCDHDTYRRRFEELDRETDKYGFAALLCCCFLEAADRRFVRDGAVADAAEVIEFVGELRARTVEVADGLDPRIAERVITAAIDDDCPDSLDDIVGASYFRTQLLILCGLAVEAELDGAELEELLARARRRADDWISHPPPGRG